MQDVCRMAIKQTISICASHTPISSAVDAGLFPVTSTLLCLCMTSGGADGRYTFVNGTDLRPYKLKSGAQFLLQGIHTTLKMHYNDTLDFLIASNSTSESFVRVSMTGSVLFSLSL